MTWKIDPAHSGITFAAKHMMITTVRGSLTLADGQIDFDENDPARSRVEARLDAASINTGVPSRDAHLRSADFLETERFPDIGFRSTRIEPAGRGRFRIIGELTIRDVTRPVKLDVRMEGVVPDRQGGRRAAFSASTTINREDFGLTWNVALEQGGWLVSKEIKVEIELAAVEAAQAAAA
jgi:polyisoprenoid-binding protein YceI